GMDGNDPAMLAALLGQSPAAKDFAPGPTTTTTLTTVPPTSTAPPTTSAPPPTSTSAPVYTTTGTWQGHSFTLTPVATRSTLFLLGTLTAFKTNDPRLACLQTGPALQIWSNPVNPSVDIVVAAQPQDCVSGIWSFPTTALNSGTGGGAATTTTT